MKFFGTYDELKKKLSSINGYWVDYNIHSDIYYFNAIFFTLCDTTCVEMVWNVKTGDIVFNGRTKEKDILEKSVIRLLNNNTKKIPNSHIKYKVVKLVKELEQAYQLEQTVTNLLNNDTKKVPNIKHVDEALNIYIKYRDNLHITEVVKMVQELEQLYHRVNKTDIIVE